MDGRRQKGSRTKGIRGAHEKVQDESLNSSLY
jgi:hypothetical protein